MKQPRCDNCGDTHPLEYLTIDRDTMDYLCPDCYNKAKSREKDSEITSAVIVMVVILIIAVVFGYVADLFFLQEVVK